MLRKDLLMKISKLVGIALFTQVLAARESEQALNWDSAEQKFTSLHPEKQQEF